MSKLKKVAIGIVSFPIVIGLLYATWCVRENYKTGDWSESCGLIFTNPQYRECMQRRTWIPRVDYKQLARQNGGTAVAQQNAENVFDQLARQDSHTIEIHGGETLHKAPISGPSISPLGFDLSRAIPLIYLGHKQTFTFACGVYGETQIPTHFPTIDKHDLACP